MAGEEPHSYLDGHDELLPRSASYMDAVGVVSRGQPVTIAMTAEHHHASAPSADDVGTTSKLQRTISMASVSADNQPPEPAPGTKSRDKSPNYPGYFHPLDQNLWHPRRVYNYITFSWPNFLLRIGASRQLEPEDLLPVASKEEAYALTQSLEESWKLQLDKPKGSLFKAFVRTFWWRWWVASFMLLVEAVLQVIEPYLLGRIIQSTADNAEDRVVYGYAAGMVGAVLM